MTQYVRGVSVKEKIRNFKREGEGKGESPVALWKKVTIGWANKCKGPGSEYVFYLRNISRLSNEQGGGSRR